MKVQAAYREADLEKTRRESEELRTILTTARTNSEMKMTNEVEEEMEGAGHTMQEDGETGEKRKSKDIDMI